MILFDTNTCFHIINQRPPGVFEQFKKYRVGEIGVSSIVASELAGEVAKSGSGRNREVLEMLIAPLQIHAFDENCIWIYAICVLNSKIVGKP